MHSINISLKNIIFKFQKESHLIHSKKENEIQRKTIPLEKGLKGYTINEKIKLPPNLNPNDIYRKLDNDFNKVSVKYKNLNLKQSSFNNLLDCNYIISISFVLNTYFTSKEKIEIPIDLYEPFYNPQPRPIILVNQIINIMNVKLNNIEEISDEEEIDLKDSGKELHSNNTFPPIKPNDIIYNRNNNLQYFKDIFKKYTLTEQSTPEQFWQMISEYYNARFDKKIDFKSIPGIIQRKMSLPLNYCFKDLVIYSINFCIIMNNQENKDEEEEELSNLLLFFEIDQSFIGLIDSNAVINKIVENFSYIYPFINYDNVRDFLIQKGMQYGGKVDEAQFLVIFKSIKQKIKEFKSSKDFELSPSPYNYQQVPPMNYQLGPPMNYQQGPPMNYQQRPPMNYQQYTPNNYY